MAGDLCYDAAQTSTLMVATAERVRHTGANERQLKAFQGVMASMREEFCDSKAEGQILFELNCIVAYEKAILEDHVASLEDQSERLTSQVSSLTWDMDVLTSELARCQSQLDRACVDGVIGRGGLQWMLDNGVVHVIDKVIESVEFSSGI